MASLSNLSIGSTYEGLLKTSDNGDLTTNTTSGAIGITDGIGTVTPLFISRDRIGIGDATPNTMLEVRDTTTQLQVSYDDANYATFAVASDGALTITSNGSDDEITLSGPRATISGITGGVTLKGNVSFGEDGTEYDVTFWGAAGRGMLWDESANTLIFGSAGNHKITSKWETDDANVSIDIDGDTIDLTDNAAIRCGDSNDLNIQHQSGNSQILNSTGSLNLYTTTGALNLNNAISGGPVNIGHTLSETTIGDNLTVGGLASVTGLLTATSGIKLGNNIIYTSDGSAAITLSDTDNVQITGNLSIVGGNITSAVTFGGSVTMSSYLSMGTEQIRVRDLRDNSGTLTFTLSGGDVTLAGDMSVLGGSLKLGITTAEVELVTSTSTLEIKQASTVEVIAPEGDDAKITLDADEGDDSGDSWHLVSVASDNTFKIQNHTTTALTITTAGNTTLAGDLTVSGNTINSSSTAALELSGDSVTIPGSLTVSSSLITFGYAETIDNLTNGTIKHGANITENRAPASGESEIRVSQALGGGDSKVTLYEGASTLRWSMGNDASDNTDYKLHWDYNNSTVGAASKMSLTSAGNLHILGNLDVEGGIITNITHIRNEDNDNAIIIDSDSNVTAATNLIVGGNFNGIGLFACNAKTPAAAPNYTVTNLSTDRNLDCNSYTTDELADVVGQIITDLIAIGLFQ